MGHTTMQWCHFWDVVSNFCAGTIHIIMWNEPFSASRRKTLYIQTYTIGITPINFSFALYSWLCYIHTHIMYNWDTAMAQWESTIFKYCIYLNSKQSYIHSPTLLGQHTLPVRAICCSSSHCSQQVRVDLNHFLHGLGGCIENTVMRCI